jgi:GNAT superfamily N-acetyltransferase
MSLRWIHESPAVWTADKARIVGRADEGIFDPRYAETSEGEMAGAQWWRVEKDGRTVAFGWLDVTWGDAEILLATEPESRGEGIGTFVLENLAREAREQGLNYMYNVVRESHPNGDGVRSWLEKRGFQADEDGRLLRRVTSESVPPPAA